MTELLEKMSYSERLRSLSKKLDYDEALELLEDFAKEVELAYRAGMLHFNALDHTLLSTYDLQRSLEDQEDYYMIDRVSWSNGEDWDPTGPVKPDLLVSLYLQEKGFK